MARPKVILAGSVIFGAITFGLGYAGMKEGLSGSLLARWCGFGRVGSILTGLIVAISLLGWFGVQNAIFARSLNFALGGGPGFALSATLSGLLLTLLVAFGFKALRFTARIAVPLFVGLVALIAWQTLSGGQPVPPLLDVADGATALTISAAITLVVGGAIVASLMTPDLTRYSRSTKHVAGTVLLTIVAGEFVINGLAIVIAHRLQSADVVTIMSQAAGGIGLLLVVFSTLRINDLNLYSSALGVINAVEGLCGKKLRYRSTTLVIGLLGTLLSVLGILDRFVDFLTLLGVVFPPILGIMLLDYFVLRSQRTVLENSRLQGTLPSVAETPTCGWPAIAATLAGSAVGLLCEWGVPTLNALVSACLLYGLQKQLQNRVRPAAFTGHQRNP